MSTPPLLQLSQPIACNIVGRLNRFVVEVRVGARSLRASTNNTGRLADFVVPGKQAYCFPHLRPMKTDLSLFAVEDFGVGAILDTRLQMRAFENAVAGAKVPWLEGCRIVRRDARSGESVIDYLVECKAGPEYLEVKSAVLRDGEYAMYPDCPSARGRRHIRELTQQARTGAKAVILFIAALPQVNAFKPYRDGDPELYELLLAAEEVGVAIKALNIIYDPRDSTVRLINADLPVELRS